MLPFAAEEVMLPGERRQLLLTTAPEVGLLERACNDDLGCFGMLLKINEAEHEPLTPILQIMEIRNPDDPGGVKGAVWTEVKCVGVARLDVVPTHATSARFKDDVFLCAEASCRTDTRPAGAQAMLQIKISAFKRALASANAKETQCGQPRGQAADTDSVASYGPASCHKRAPLSMPLDAVVAARREALLQNGLDEAPSTSLRDLQSVWGMRCPLEGEAQLISWAAFAWLGGQVRLEALRSRSWVERLELARDGLRERERELHTEIALERLLNHESG